MVNKENNKKYHIDENYCERSQEYYFDDTSYKDEFQDGIYKYASDKLIENNYTSVVDVGCGSGYKLIKYFDDKKTLGLDLEKTVNWLKLNYPNKEWKTFDELNEFEYDLIICSDVIEHIYDVDILIDTLKKINFKTLILSTPERLTMYGGNRLEEPSNHCHIREWSFDEFRSYCDSIFIVENHVQMGNTQLIEISNFK